MLIGSSKKVPVKEKNMRLKSKTNFLLKIALCVALALSTFGAVLGFVGEKPLTAQAETVEYQDILAVENRSWGAASDEYYFGGYTIGVTTDGNAHWLNTDASVNGCWYNGNDALITANNGVDILQYIYVNGTSARDAITENNGALLGSSGWLTNPAASPVYVETTNGSGLIIKILKAYAGESYTLTFKAGFSLIRSDGNVLYVSDDVVYNCVGNVPTRVNKNTVTFNNESSVAVSTKRVVSGQAIGALPEVPAKDGYVGFWTIDGVAVTESTVISANKTATPVYALEYEDLLGLEDRAWGAHDGEYYFGGVTLSPFGYFNTQTTATWHADTTAPITENVGIDIMKYIYVNGECARDLIVANYNGAQNKNSCGCWLSNPAAWPVYVETTTGSGIMIRLAKAYFGDTITFTFKKGFSLVRSDGERIYVSSDIIYTYENNAFTSRSVEKTYKLTFEGTDTVKNLKANATIGELPAVPAKDGCTGAWTIDGVEITADTVYSYGANKTATVVYSKDITDTIGLGDWGVPETESDIRYLWIRDNNAEIATAYPNSYWNDHADNKDSNYGVDIMEYILIDGESARSIINANAAGTTSYKAASTFPLSKGGCYAPVCIETAGDGIRFKVMVDYKTSFKVTFKAGFTLINSEGTRLYTAKDVSYNVGATADDIQKVEDEAVDITDTLTMEDRAWGAHDGEVYVALLNNGSYFNTSVNGAWYVGNDDIIAANGGLDIMQYILLNGVSARELITANANGGRLSNSCSCWLSNPAAYPIYVESSAGSGLMIRIAKAYAGTEFTLTFKAGFTITDVDGNVVTISKDLVFSYANGTITKAIAYTLSFESSEGSVDPITVKDGLAIGELPAVPEKDGFAGIWTIDGVQITSETLYTYGENKTAVAQYVQKIFTLTFENVSSQQVEIGTAIGALPAIPEKSGYVAFAWAIDGAIITEESIYNYAEDKTATPIYALEYTDLLGLEDRAWGAHEGEYYFGGVTLDPFGYFNSTVCDTWYVGNNNPITANNGVDIMQYIYINDTSARDLIVANKNGEKLSNSCSCWLSNPAASPVYVETTNGDGIIIRVLKSFVGDSFTITFKAGFSLIRSDGEIIYLSKDVNYKYVNGTLTRVQEYTLSFEGLDDTLTVIGGEAIGTLPNVPENGDCEGVWIIDGVEIDENTVYTYSENKTATASYSLDITKTLALEDRAWGACSTGEEYYLGVLDTREANAVVGAESTTYYLNSTVTGCWHADTTSVITANGGVDIMQYIYVNDVSARDLITENANGDRLGTSCTCWLSNPAAYPVYVETTNGSGIMIKIAKAYVGNYFEITFKKGFSLINEDGDKVYLSKDITFKYIVSDEDTTLAKGEITDAELDVLGGQQITLKVNGENYLVNTTVRLTLPQPESYVENGIKHVFVGWTTDPENLSDLYPAGYGLQPDSAMELHAVWLGFEMEEGAAVRLAVNSGIRFTTHIASDYKTVLKGLVSEVGTILCPTSYLVNGRELTHSLPEGYFVAKDADAELFISNSGTYTYATAFVGIQEKDYTREYSARGYIKVNFTTGVGYVYTDYSAEENSRSIYEVAVGAYNDTEVNYKENEIILNYLSKVLDVTWEDYEFTVNSYGYSAYSNASLSLNGNTITVSYEGEVASVIVNGYRLIASGNVNVPIGNLLYNFSGLELADGSATFTLGAANNTYDKNSEETLYFESSDEDLDFFLNDFFKRHMGVVEDGERLSVNSTVAGVSAEEFFNQEWVSMSYYWHNASEGFTNEKGYTEDRIAGLNERLTDVPVDDYGYVWSSNDRVRDPYSEILTGEQKMGWPFPNNDTVNTAHWEFNGSSEGSWSSNVSASVSGGLYQASLSNQSSNVTFSSNSFSSWTSKKIYTFYAPLLEFEVRIADVTNVEDIVVWYTTSSSTSFSEDKSISVSKYAFLSYDIANATGEYNHILYLPMYAQTAWGESTSTYVKQLKIEIVLKSGKTLSGNVALNYVRPTLDTRMSNNNSIYISSLRTAYDYTGDTELLKATITKARKAMNFLMQMYDTSKRLKKESYLVGHGGVKEDLNWLGKATAESIASSISQGYWDIMYMPEYDFQSNVYFYKALVDMAYLESVVANLDGVDDKSLAVINTATRSREYGESAYNYTSTNLNRTASQMLAVVKKDLSAGGFWNPETGRYAAGKDPSGNVYDYGYVAWNLEAIYYGVATDAQATSIMAWLAGEGDDLYEYAFAPLSITETGDANALNGEYEAKGNSWVNCQFGGAILYTSFYDIMARLDVNGADDAYARLTAIREWYKTVYDYYVANGTDPYDFYRYYYDNQGIQLQGQGTAGEVGIDSEFLESSLPLASVAYGFFGIDADGGNTLSVTPELPSNLTKWGMENLAFNGVKYDLTIYGNAIQLSNVSGDVAGLSLTIALDYAEGQRVYVNGIEVTDFTVENNKAVVTVAFGATVVEVR